LDRAGFGLVALGTGHDDPALAALGQLAAGSGRAGRLFGGGALLGGCRLFGGGFAVGGCRLLGGCRLFGGGFAVGGGRGLAGAVFLVVTASSCHDREGEQRSQQSDST
jgi:hypothetical protein